MMPTPRRGGFRIRNRAGMSEFDVLIELDRTRRPTKNVDTLRRYGDVPISILSFVEGTRYSREKQEDQQSPYRFLLRPRVGGIGFVLPGMLRPRGPGKAEPKPGSDS